MVKSANDEKKKKILLTGVFGPFGVDDEYGRKENIMELFHNQVTKAQKDASFRFHHRSFGLYFIAANIDADTTVLDFPTKGRFIKEIKKGDYDIIGISFIAPNFIKARKMAELVREHAPDAEIILGGHGAAVENIESQIPCDHAVKGEGIRWMRRHLGQNPDAPFVHPALPSTERQSIFGVPVPGPTASLLVPGVGCVNGCSFCSTSHFFGRTYTSFIDSGRRLFETARRIADTRGTDTFFVMDENFLKNKERALDLISEMEKEQRFFQFHLFSSAEAITAFGIDNLVRLGVQFVWIGFESQTDKKRFSKNDGIDAKKLVREMRDRGISVLASGIMCMEHHTHENIRIDRDYMVDLDADMVQFMLLTPLPVTGLYKDHKARGLLRDDVAWEDVHGQKLLNYKHPVFKGDEPEKLLNQAFRQDYETNGSSIFRVIDTAVRGYKSISKIENPDRCLQVRKTQIRTRAEEYSLLLPVIAKYAVNEKERTRALSLLKEVDELFAPVSLKTRIMRSAAVGLAAAWRMRVALKGDMIQPSTIVTHFKGRDGKLSKSPVPVVEIDSRIIENFTNVRQAAAAVGLSE
jgi:radical SAM superfamily enzyme YgiQ (UPF0313 family)